jgi:hypothetical protein
MSNQKLTPQNKILSIDQAETNAQGEDNTSESNSVKEDRSYHPSYIRKKKVRVKLRMQNGLSCIGDCHVLWPDGRTSDAINDERPFFLLTNATVEGERNVYDILTLNKSSIEMIFEIHRYEQ